MGFEEKTWKPRIGVGGSGLWVRGGTKVIAVRRALQLREPLPRGAERCGLSDNDLYLDLSWLKQKSCR